MKQTIPAYPTLSCYIEATKPKLEVTSKAKVKPKTESKSKLKIGLISTPMLKVFPDNYGGLESVLGDLAEALAIMGHDITVFATNGSKVKGCKVVEFGEPANKVNVDWLQAERNAHEVYKNMLSSFDIVHGMNWFGMEYKAKALNPQLHVCHTHHGGLNPEYWCRSKPPFKLNFIAISQWMQKVYASQGFTSQVCYNGINLEKYPLSKNHSERYLFLSRISKIKAPHVAVEVAKKAKIELDIVGATSFVDDPSYVTIVKNQCDEKQIRFVGEVSHEEKLKYLQNAKALIVTGKWGEPFGLHVIESLAVGTPVIAFPDGGVAETVKEGGILCSDVDALVDAVKQVDTISSKACRRNAERFSREKCAENYLKCYEDILNGKEW